jgi:hypothetical protein
MKGIDSLVRDGFLRDDPLPAGLAPDWDDVVRRSRPRATSTRRQLALRTLAIAVVVVVGAVAVATAPLRAAIADAADGFAAWISGSPGTPASPADQQAFEQGNARSWTSFPPGVQLRQLIQTTAAGSQFTLFGFRSGDSLCLRLVATGPAAGTHSECAPVQALQTATTPALVLATDDPFEGDQAQQAPPPGTYNPLLASATFGIVSDGVKDVIVASDDGTNHATVSGNAFMYVDDHPTVGARVRDVTAVAADGKTEDLPVAIAPFGNGLTPPPAHPLAPQGPTGIDRHLTGGTINWLERGEPRGEPLPADVMSRLSSTWTNISFAREIQPDPANPAKIAFLIGQPEHTLAGPGPYLAIFLITGSSMGGGITNLQQIFIEQPFELGISLDVGGDQYAYFSGAASDDVASMKVYLANGAIEEVPLKDNAFVVQVERGLMPARVVAYDNQGKILGNQLIKSAP